MFRRLAMTACALALGVAPLLASARPPEGDAPPRGDRHGRRVEAALDQLGLTEAQRAQLATQRDARRARVKPLKEQLRALHGQLEALWAAPDPSVNRAAIAAKRAEVDAVRSKLAAERDEGRFALLRVLTPEQRVRFEQAMGERKGKGRRGPPGA